MVGTPADSRDTYVGGAPNCTPYECTASPDDPINGAFEDCSSHSTGEVCELSCIPGFEQVGADAICFAAATWNGSPTCEPASCDAPAAVEHGSFVDCANVNHGESCQLNCEAGYSKSGSDQTCWFGEYLGAAPSCDALGCSAPADPPHGSYECASLSHGSSCELQCDTGYLKSGADPTCLLGNYGSLPTCDPVCGDVPSSGCHQLGAGSSSLLIKNSDDDARDQLKWKWSGGDATDIAEFGDPVLGTTELHLCVYDSSANMQPLAEVIVAPGGTCGALPCWAATGSTGFRYKDKSGALDGAQGIKLKAAAPDRATIQVKAAGASLPTPTLPATGTVTVQFIATGGTGSGSSCWQSVFPAPTANDEGVLKAKVP